MLFYVNTAPRTRPARAAASRQGHKNVRLPPVVHMLQSAWTCVIVICAKRAAAAAAAAYCMHIIDNYYHCS